MTTTSMVYHNKPTGDIFLDTAKGSVKGHTSVNKFGKTTNVDSGVDTDIHDGANATDTIAVWVAPTQARAHTVKSTDAGDVAISGAGARTIRVFGLVSWSTKEVYEDVLMDGTSDVNLVNDYVIIHRMRVLTKGNTSSNIGVITATAAVDGTVTAQINAGLGQTLMAIYGIPSSITAYMVQYYASAIKANTALSVDVTLRVNPEPDVQVSNFLVKHNNGVATEGTNYLTHRFAPYYKIPGPAIIKLQANSSAANTVVSGGFDLVLVGV